MNRLIMQRHYDCVFVLQSTAVGAVAHYESGSDSNNPCRFHTVDQAAAQDPLTRSQRTEQPLHCAHTRLCEVPNTAGGMSDKLQSITATVAHWLRIDFDVLQAQMQKEHGPPELPSMKPWPAGKLTREAASTPRLRAVTSSRRLP